MVQQKDDDNKKTVEEEFITVTDFPVSFAIFGLARSHRALAAQLLREAGLFPGQEILLMQLWHQDHQSQNSLCRTLRLDHSTVAKSVRRLVDSGLVTCSRSQEDKRVTIVSLTQAGRDFEPKVTEAWSKLENLTIEALNEQEKKLLVDLSRKIAAVLDPFI
jgi:DNA-binding MarR family transcriptional regulator